MIDPAALQIVLGVLTGWLDRRERGAVAYLIDTSGASSRSSSRTITSNGITKDSTIG